LAGWDAGVALLTEGLVDMMDPQELKERFEDADTGHQELARHIVVEIKKYRPAAVLAALVLLIAAVHTVQTLHEPKLGVHYRRLSKSGQRIAVR